MKKLVILVCWRPAADGFSGDILSCPSRVAAGCDVRCHGVSRGDAVPERDVDRPTKVSSGLGEHGVQAESPSGLVSPSTMKGVDGDDGLPEGDVVAGETEPEPLEARSSWRRSSARRSSTCSLSSASDTCHLSREGLVPLPCRRLDLTGRGGGRGSVGGMIP